MTNTQYIQQLLQAVDITPGRVALHKGQPFGPALNNAYTQQPSHKMLFQTLEGLVYTLYYCKNTLEQPDMQQAPSYAEMETALHNLSAHNHSYEGFDEGWVIGNIDMQGQVTASKGNLKRQVFAGEFISSSMFHQKPVVNAGIKLIARKEHIDPGAGFYYVFGSTLAEDNMDQLVRVYFNIKPDGAPLLIKELTLQLNELQLPFTFKCLQHAFYYTRSDTAVLYFDKRYSPLVFDTLGRMYPVIQPYLNPDCPAFTKQLGPGVAFAENPVKQDESFGTHCSKMIVQGIMNAYTKGLPKQQWLAEIKNTIEQKHQYKSMDVLYMNPSTRYPYQFPTLTDKK